MSWHNLIWPISCLSCFAYSKELDLSTLHFSLQCHFSCFVEDSRVPTAHFTSCFWTKDIFCLDEKLTCHTLNTMASIFLLSFCSMDRVYIKFDRNEFWSKFSKYPLYLTSVDVHFPYYYFTFLLCSSIANIMAISFYYQLLDFLYVFLSKSKIPFVLPELKTLFIS